MKEIHELKEQIERAEMSETNIREALMAICDHLQQMQRWIDDQDTWQKEQNEYC